MDIKIPLWLQNSLDKSLAGSNQTEDKLIAESFKFACQLHEGQYRKSGEPYICHPIAVASLLQDLGGSAAMIAAGSLHDVVEDTEVTIEEIETLFGEEVKQLVEGVTKLSKINFKSKTEGQAENFRRMFLAMAMDIRVIVVKLADRLHNMRTLEHLSDTKRHHIALETKEIFAPLANRLGIWHFKWELEDLSFKYLEPEAYRKIQTLVAEKRGVREERLQQASKTLLSRLEKAGIHCLDLSGRPKHLYSIYQKMQSQNKEFHEIYDLAALRIIVKAKDECYRALAVVHDAFLPIPGRFKDYIGLPKANQYQSLHTGVIGPWGGHLEIQIRTIEMHHIAEYGIAAHWKYKETGSSHNTNLTAADETFTWLRHLLEWENDLKDAQEYLDSVKDNLFESDVYVFTPKGDLVDLKAGSTPIDFAYRIHTEIGNHCAGAKANGRIVPLSTSLRNGDIVEIITQKSSQPSIDCLNFAKTSLARNRIRQLYKRTHREENIARGKDAIEKACGKKGFENLLKSRAMQTVVEKSNYHSVDDLLAALGHGEITLNFVLNRLREGIKSQQPLTSESEIVDSLACPVTKSREIIPSGFQSGNSTILGVEGLMHHPAGCCNPIPGEPIIGVVTRGKGIRIHHQECQNIEVVKCDRLIPISWNIDNDNNVGFHTYPVRIQIKTLDRVGVLKDILARLSDHSINVRHANVKTSLTKPAQIDLEIEISSCTQLEQLFSQIKKMSDVINIRRLGHVNS
ncbi:GTP pyrophosphokinase [Richelia intracellularis HH01]|uniref:GTP pyrophosphokinase n=3 Tax=Richelia TaxID=98443 RepID=M1X0D5_9NOST|nr:bifunctional (p)ppGpp synthetase/guanosine-3',5'-bis(diphosphate) 3'-pyrophosphohydrolase [Richelia intracellularis]CCH68207.1 GTP pyrophosphokinase [Richelia intracellularis HH01]